ncbi:MAG: bifunctional diguanylate cyclase/phosphodiesterase [Pseudomonadota bacterium]|nr:bifunctional diguanylate cyclase/phosphodiesterase [Pseudomonadota bacterium]
MTQHSISRQQGRVVHAGFLLLLLLVLGLGIAVQQVLLMQQETQLLQQHTVRAERLAGLLPRQPGWQALLAGQASRAEREDLQALILAFGPIHYQLSRPDGPAMLSDTPDTVSPEQVSIPTSRQAVVIEGEDSPRVLIRVPVGDPAQASLELVAPADSLAVLATATTRTVVVAMLLLLGVGLLALTGLDRWLVHRSRLQDIELSRRAYHDDLTGLPNRVLFWDRLERACAHARREEKLVALVRINIDRFQRINHALGHAVADRLLIELAQRLRNILRSSDSVIRMCADDFAIIMGDVERKDEIEKAVLRLIEVADEPYLFDEHEIDITTRVGIAVYPIDHQEDEKLLMSADAAMQRAKKTGGRHIAFYTPEMGEGSAGRLRAEHGLRAALEQHQFELHYQPKVDSTSGAIKGFEALIRWQHPQRGLVPPLEFVPVLEESGLIIPVGEWVIREACAASNRWQAEGLPVLPISVNVAAPQFEQNNFTSRIQHILEESQADPGNLEIEVTESCLMSDVATSARVLEELKSMGVRIAVDDFGTGYSSLSHLKRFPIDTLKIDRSFVTNVNDRASSDNASIVTAIMALSHSLRLNVVAEGVETARELAYLHALGCHTIQGFLFSRPVNEKEVMELLRDTISMQEILAGVREELKA